MEDKIKNYLRSRRLVTASIVELVSVILVSIFDFSILKIIVLTILNFTICIFFFSYIENHIRRILTTKNIYNQFNLRRVLNSYIQGIAVIIFSYFFYPKFYALGIALLIMGSITLLLRKRMEIISKDIRKISFEKAKKLFYDRSFFTGVFMMAIPILFDFHYLVLPIVASIYFIILTLYFIMIISLIIISSHSNFLNSY